MFEKAGILTISGRRLVFVLTPERLPIFETERAIISEHSGIKSQVLS